MLLNVRGWEKVKAAGVIVDWDGFERVCQKVYGVDTE